MTLSLATLAKRSPWLTEVETATQAWREMRAELLERESVKLDDGRVHVLRALDGTFQGIEEVDTWIASPWHTARAHAHRERFERLQNCGQRTRREKCACPGDSPGTRPTVIRCDHWSLCLECKGRRASRYRARFTLGRSRALAKHERRTRKFASGGRWSEKMLTVTVPHWHVSRDVETLRIAWATFRASLARYMLRTSGVKKWRNVPYWRSLEATSSDAGHAHYHVWMLCPFLPVYLVRHLWGRALPADYRARLPVMQLRKALDGSDARNHRALRSAAVLDVRLADAVHAIERDARNARARFTYATTTNKPAAVLDALRARCEALATDARMARDEASYLYAPVVYVSACGADVATELVKYICKDTIKESDGTQTPIDAVEFARLYAALSGARVVATSPHLVDDAKPDEKRGRCCLACGVEREVVFVWSQAGVALPAATSPPVDGCTHLPAAA